MKANKEKTIKKRYLPLEDIRQINSEFLDEMERVKVRLDVVKDLNIITAFQEVLLTAYKSAIEIRAKERVVDYEIKISEIKARRSTLHPLRRGWWWRLLFRPLTNRAQDIIDSRARLNADIAHTAAEAAIKSEREAQAKSKTETEQTEPKQIEQVQEPALEREQIVLTDLPRPRAPTGCRRPRT